MYLNKLTWKNFDKLTSEFDFGALTQTESPENIAHSISVKLRKNPLMSEIYVVVLLEICQAYDPETLLPTISKTPILESYNNEKGSLLCSALLTHLVDGA
mmetsp:Transcript_42581/g.40844  ORF Transcript_42581/g.40844 Transcript_42581/m.40844 type:complete len:100 (-) Transcript_42581:535-834(-)